MSHFSVIVTGEDVAKQLQPFHEFECTGIVDEFVRDVDKTEEARKLFLESSTRRYKSPNGELHNPYQDHFYRYATPEETKTIGIGGTGRGGGISWTSKDWGDGKGYRAKVHFMPEGWEKVDVPIKDVETFSEWAHDYYGMNIWPVFGTEPERDNEEFKYGFISLESTGEVKRVVDRTNPDAHWDWFQVGGRYSDQLLLRDGSKVDSAIKRDIDYDIMRAGKIEDAITRYDMAMAIFGNLPVHKSWEEMNHDREAYRAQSRLVEWKKQVVGFDHLLSWASADDFLLPRQQFLKNASNQALGAFAFLHEGKWLEKGSMGWWGSVRGEKTDEEWYQFIADQVLALPDDTRITIVDCHI